MAVRNIFLALAKKMVWLHNTGIALKINGTGIGEFSSYDIYL
jgi:hypothetical protein